jgi:preprotein translocase subunit SecE
MAVKLVASDAFSDKAKWLLAITLLMGNIVINCCYAEMAWPWRVACWLILLLLLVVASQTKAGKQAIVFARAARTELYKITWPSRQETLHTTIIVGVIVVVISLMLWVIDSGVMWLIAWLTGQRG